MCDHALIGDGLHEQTGDVEGLRAAFRMGVYCHAFQFGDRVEGDGFAEEA